MPGAIPTLTYSNLANFLTQLIYTRTKSPQKGIPVFRKAWNMPVLSLIYSYQIHSHKTNDCVLDLSELT